MGKYDKLLYKILSGRSDSNVAFSELMQLLQRLGFDLRIRGDHHIFTRQDIVEILNLQPAGSMAKPYQVKQVRQVIVKYQLGVIDE
ncbi:type II toxin-antitoxin system HicA family toxin [Methylicorpusculum sp.]|uniref:type II toxin-antitoxin system HicA family toxin n=1 Tax=Methylicorpusculum sp. TaxID=2713644 RepID=UPI002724860B|nr:type II toxin-antitoxin system HicA family toxin [Methylicorpusculum sp.]MDO9239802.1 type II toxin-antitoxin system HicA family toxin [Methylicorpusculum sp.]MDP2176944.1 type II toxin-antitoxin system HicA family toxin [Methylicorpusculum sp.]MDP3528714.1 type II toxin-antitoxin system HicA family toxin [Methylicorpusculum sp.]MDZ4153866.1 type II toxin-antitoxin system HicA family toxin [Methylicorpusculum sp.]